ncbi:MAG: tripartite tricarboxylate transporter permease [Synergistetes bacterium]|nr:tripartite tricarboxylate transporter permease [Synergistota bacterium]
MEMLLYVVYILIGTFVGLVMGALPGLTVTMTMVLVVSLTFGWHMMDALAFIVGAFCGGVMGGSIAAVALNIPGTAAAVATVFDGYPLKQKGEADTALALAMFFSLLGGLFGILFLSILGPIIGSFALKFGDHEYFLMCLWGLTLVSILSKGSMLKGLAAACLGLLIAFVGMDSITGLMRFTFGSTVLGGGINYIVAMIGLFGMKEVLTQLSARKAFKVEGFQFHLKDLFPKLDLVKKVFKCFFWSAPIGSIIGLLPGTGGDIGALVAYGVSKQMIKEPTRPFGDGAYEGVAAPETANDAAIGGAITTLLTLGIPGDSVTAVMLGSFYLHGLLPGPTFMLTERHYFYMILIFLLIGVLFAYILGILGSNLMLRMLNLPKWFLIPSISILCIVGSYALRNNIYDVLFMILFGLLGYAMEKGGYPVSPIVLSLILGSLIETSFRKALIISGGLPALLVSFFTRPLSLIIILLVVASYVLQYKYVRKGV